VLVCIPAREFERVLHSTDTGSNLAGAVEKMEANEEILALTKHIEQYLDVLMFFTQEYDEVGHLSSALVSSQALTVTVEAKKASSPSARSAFTPRPLRLSVPQHFHSAKHKSPSIAPPAPVGESFEPFPSPSSFFSRPTLQRRKFQMRVSARQNQ
jgi:hypothetical protein